MCHRVPASPFPTLAESPALDFPETDARGNRAAAVCPSSPLAVDFGTAVHLLDLGSEELQSVGETLPALLDLQFWPLL